MRSCIAAFLCLSLLGLVPGWAWGADEGPATPADPGSALDAVLDPEARRPAKDVEEEIDKLITDVPTAKWPSLVDRPIVFDYENHSLVLGYRRRGGERDEPAPAAGFPRLTFDTKTTRTELTLDYKGRLGDHLEVGVRIPYLKLKESRPSRIDPAAGGTFVLRDDVREDSGLSDVELHLARGWNRPGLSRRLALNVKSDSGPTGIPDAGSLPLGTGQWDYSLSYAVKQTRGHFALTGEVGLTLREEGTVPDLSGVTRRFEPGDQGFASLRGDWRITDWWTGSLILSGRASERASLDGVSLAGSRIQHVALTPVWTYQASDELEIIAELEIPLVSHGTSDGNLFGGALRWRY